jgi:hypothetical protein
MEFKFNKGDHVSFIYGSVFSPSKIGMFEAVVNGGKIIARKGCGTSRGPEYRVDGFTGWWPEKCLVLIARGPENLHCCEESSEAITYTQNETKCDTGDSGAFWTFEIPGYAKCSSCGRSFEALPTESMFKENNKFCRMCGKAMEVRDED